MEPVRLPGETESFGLAEVQGARSVGSRRRPLLARGRELAAVEERFRSALAGAGQAVVIGGEPGIGKSRLVAEIRGSLSSRARWVTSQGSPFETGAPLQPVAELVARAAGLDDGVPESQRLEHLETLLDGGEATLAEGVPLLAEQLGIDAAGRYPPSDLAPEMRRRRTRELIVELLLASAHRSPLVLLVEDLHWLDPMSLEVLGDLAERVPEAPLLLLTTHRPEARPPWSDGPNLLRLELAGLEPDDVKGLIASIGEGRPLPSGVIEQIVTQTDGVPLFVEELTRALLESGQLVAWEGRYELAEPLRPLALPATLRESLTARLDRMGPAKGVAQEAAVLGREVDIHLLAEVSSTTGGELRAQLERLVAAGLLLRSSSGEEIRYSFKHALVRDTAYESLLVRERRDLHARIGRQLELRQAVAARHPGLLAHHFDAAGLPGPASRYWLAAGELAIARSANVAGIEHLRRGLAAAGKMEAGGVRSSRELALYTRLGAALSVTRGYSFPEVEECFASARRRCDALGESPQLFWVVWGLWAFHLVRSELGRALELGERLVRLAEASGDDGLRIVALSTVGQAYYFRGDLAEARSSLARAAALDDPGRSTPLASASGQDVGVVVLAALSLVLWHLGEDDGAVRCSERAVELAHRVGHSYSLAFAHVYAARLHQSRGDVPWTRHHAQKVIELSTRKGFFWLAQGRFFEGAALAQGSLGEDGKATDRGAFQEARRLMDEGLDAYRAAGARLSITYMLAQRAELELWDGDPQAAGEWLEKARGAAESSDEGYWRAELERLAGEVLQAQGDDAAQGHFRRARELAHEGGDRAFATRLGG
ncbi:MAG: AAA family ATPase [Acidobacteriota bacterium]